jgi:hypothetical protein
MKRVWIVENAVPFDSLPYRPPFVENKGIAYLLGNVDANWPEAEVRSLCQEFSADQYDLTVLASPDSLQGHLRSGPEPPHVVIFDWEGLGFRDDLNVTAIGQLLTSTFSYVQVYTHLGADAPEIHLGPLRAKYGSRLLAAKAKNQVTADDLRNSISAAWQNTIAGAAADAVRSRARDAVERVLVDLCSVRKSALAAMSDGDANQFLNLVMAKLRDEIGSNGLDQMAEIVKGGGAANATEDLRRLQSAFYYYFPKDDLVRTGDVVKTTSNGYGVVITPWCNLEKFQKKTGGYLTIVGACELKGAGLGAAGIVKPGKSGIGNSATASHGEAAHSIVALPNVPTKPNDRGSLVDLALIAHDWSTLRIKNVQGALRYSAVENRTRVCTLTETFSGAVISHLAKTISSQGIPDFPQFERDRLSELAKA